jgi:hypothetical protein
VDCPAGRSLLVDLAERAGHLNFLIRDRDSSFVQASDEAFAGNGLRERVPRLVRPSPAAARWRRRGPGLQLGGPGGAPPGRRRLRGSPLLNPSEHEPRSVPHGGSGLALSGSTFQRGSHLIPPPDGVLSVGGAQGLAGLTGLGPAWRARAALADWSAA